MKRHCFTLAEVLITLAIIGVVAALTIPSVVQNYQERQTVTKVKKFYSDINQAFQMATVNKGKIENYGAKNSKELFNYFKPYLKVIKECEGADKTCLYNGTYKTLNKNVDWANVNPNLSIYHKVILSDGSSVWFFINSSDCTNSEGTSLRQRNKCGSIGVDINGYKSPNQFGVDTFYFKITKIGVFPLGLPDDSVYKLNNYCNLSGTNTRNGYACIAWIIAKGNMDYLRKTVSW